MEQSGWRLGVKQLFDRGAALVGLVATAPILLGAAAAVRVTLGRPVLFRQPRPGRHGVPFELIKLRTMRDARDARGRELPDGERLTALGRFLRSTSIDELPQLVNVLRGELSIVGPRPLLMRYLPRYSPEQARRHDVLPGMTSWTALHGRNDQSWPAKLAHDIYYVDHWSLWLDARIIVATVWLVLGRRGVSRAGEATTAEFLGEP